MNPTSSDRHAFRASWHDYACGVYFITICAHEKRHLFGKISNNAINLSYIGLIVRDCILSLPQHNDMTEIWNYVIMPNHIHMVISVGARYIAPAQAQEPTAPAQAQEPTAPAQAQETTLTPGYIAPAQAQEPSAPAQASETTLTPGYIAPAQAQETSINRGCLKPPRHGEECEDYHYNSRLAVIIGTFKAAVTRIARARCIAPLPGIWQRSFHDHIIRDQRAFENIMNYIDNNVTRWADDCFNKL